MGGDSTRGLEVFLVDLSAGGRNTGDQVAALLLNFGDGPFKLAAISLLITFAILGVLGLLIGPHLVELRVELCAVTKLGEGTDENISLQI